MYNNNSFGFNYDMKVVIKDEETEQEIVSFNARENASLVNDANFEAGGVASGGQNYSIVTNADVFDKIIPYKHQAFVDGVEYKVLSKNQVKTGIYAQYSKRKNKETIIFLG